MSCPPPSIESEVTAQNRRNWEEKPVLQRIYADLYRRMAAECGDGMSLEVGGGSGNFKQFNPQTWSTDIAFAPWLDAVADAQRLPFPDASLTNIVMFDVLHHIEFPSLFFAEASRTLKPGGRVVMVEPAITAFSWPFYNFIHQEPVDLGENPLRPGIPTSGRDPYAGNQAIPTLLATTRREQFLKDFPDLSICKVEWLSLFAYPLSGGFKKWSLIPTGWVDSIISIENRLTPLLGRVAGFRMLLVVERKPSLQL